MAMAMAMADGGGAGGGGGTELTGISFRDQLWLNSFPLERALVFDYFALSPFYDPTCNNQTLRMRSIHPLDISHLSKMIGMEYMLYEVQEPNFFVFRKQKRESPEKVTPSSAYYILDGSIYQAPNIHNVIGSRVVRSLYHIAKAFSEASTKLEKIGYDSESAEGLKADSKGSDDSRKGVEMFNVKEALRVDHSQENMADTDDDYCSDCVSNGSTEDEGCTTIFLSKHLVPKLTTRKKNVSEARWITEGGFAGMAEVTKVKGKLLQTTGIVREGRIFLHIEEIGYLMQREALNLYHRDSEMPIMALYSYIMKSEYGYAWDSFKVYLELKTLGYVVSRHNVPWSISMNASIGHKNILDCSSDELSTCVESLTLSGSFENPDRRQDLDLVFDVFAPNSKFKKTDPGIPDFSLLISSDNPPGLVDIETLKAQNGDVPVMIATVDCGRVSFFRFDTTELPLLP